MLFTITGYVVFTVYTCGIMFLGELVERKTRIDKLICRKLTHIISAFVWIICYFFFGCSVHWVILNGIGAAVLGVVTFCNFGKAYSREDASKSYGLFYFGLSTFIVALICYLVGEELYLYTGIAYYCLALGDGFAPIVAKLLKRHNPLITPTRSLFGSLTVFIISFLATLAFSLIFNMNLGWLFMLSVAALTAVMEFYGFKGLDNLFIEFGVFGYLLLYHYGFVSVTLEVVVILSFLLAFVAVGKKSLTPMGGLLAFVIFFIVGLFGGGYVPAAFLAASFVISILITAITNKFYFKNKQEEAKEARSGRQVLAVGLVAAICLIAAYFTQLTLFYYLYYLAVAEQLADSLASDMGRLTRHRNIDIIRFKPIEKGISGGVSLLGTACAFAGSFIFLVIPLCLNIFGWQYFLILGALAFLGTLIDSVIGSLVQALYMCDVCGVKVEVAVHCGRPARLVKGVSFIKNTEVNLITSLLICLISAIILIFI